MEQSKKVLNFAIAFSIITLSLSVFIYSIRDSKAKASPQSAKENYSIAGVAYGDYTIRGKDNSTKVTGYILWGYNPADNTMKALSIVSKEGYSYHMPQ